jgi:hypothetical protein
MGLLIYPLPDGRTGLRRIERRRPITNRPQAASLHHKGIRGF